MASFTPAVKSVYSEIRPLVLLLIFMNFISDGKCQTISLSCPDLQENSKTVFNCTVRTATCTHSAVTFNFVKKDGTAITQCRANSSTCDLNPQDAMACGCFNSDSGSKYYRLIFYGNKETYDGGKLTCSANCASGPADNVCQPLTFAVPSTSPSTTTVKSVLTTSYSPSATTSSSSSSTKTVNNGSSGSRMHVSRTAIVAFMSGIIALISANIS